MEILEDEGIVGPREDGESRRVLATPLLTTSLDTLETVKTVRTLLAATRAKKRLRRADAARSNAFRAARTLTASKSFERFRVCHSCGFHFHLTARERLATLLDVGTFHEDDRGVTAIDPLSFQDRQSYRSRVISAQRRTGLTEAALTGTGSIFGRDVVIAVVDFSFLGGSIGVAAGERLARAFEKATSRRVPVVLVCSTSGTRMQEGLLALMQGPRIAAAVETPPAGRTAVHRGADGPDDGLGVHGVRQPRGHHRGRAERAHRLCRVAGVAGELWVGPASRRAHVGGPPGATDSIDAVVPRPALRDSLAPLLDLTSSVHRRADAVRGRAGEGLSTRRTDCVAAGPDFAPRRPPDNPGPHRGA